MYVERMFLFPIDVLYKYMYNTVHTLHNYIHMIFLYLYNNVTPGPYKFISYEEYNY